MKINLSKQIRLGNIIQLKNEDYITTVEYSTFSIGKLIDINYEGVPITEKWLHQMGFEIVVDNEFTKRLDLKIDARFDYFLPKHNLKTFGLRFQGITFFEEINYVHQVQNLYIDLTGKELVFSYAVS
jgi:hypothetical protein